MLKNPWKIGENPWKMGENPSKTSQLIDCNEIIRLYYNIMTFWSNKCWKIHEKWGKIPHQMAAN